jgi:hypothetical protein
MGNDIVKIGKHMGAVWRKYSDDHLIMSDEFVRIFESFISEHDAGDPNDATHALHLHRRKIITKYRALLLAQARKELAGGGYRKLATLSAWPSLKMRLCPS